MASLSLAQHGGMQGQLQGAPGLGLSPLSRDVNARKTGKQHPFIHYYLVQHCCALGAFVNCSFLSK